MYLHLGQSTVITTDEIVGIFDLDNTTVSAKTRDFLNLAEKENRVKYVSQELPKSFIVCKDKTVYVSQIACSTLVKRAQHNLTLSE